MKRKDGMFKIALCIALAILLTIGCLALWKLQMNRTIGTADEAYTEYQYHYVLITEDGNETFWQSVYEGAVTRGDSIGAYVERMGSNLAVDYSKEELMEIAIASGVDGIILEGDESEVQQEMIKKAVDAGIPVITALNDNYGSDRNAFVGISDYDLGREYARQVIKFATTQMDSVLIFVDANSSSSGQNIVYDGFADTLANEGNHLQLDVVLQPVYSDDAFGTQEVIRNIFVNQTQIPDVMICLNETNTISAYQAIVDYNMVGDVTIIGYYDSATIINAIEKGVIYSTVVVDAQQMGELCIDAMNEYITTGYVSDYITMNVNVVNEKNVGDYVNEEEPEPEQ